LDQTAYHCPKELFFILEVEVDRPFGYSRLRGDIVEARRLKPMSSEDLESGPQDFLLPMRLLLLPAGRGLGPLESPEIYRPH
jgi:hypothetical protein